jgi:hypothetical protein
MLTGKQALGEHGGVGRVEITSINEGVSSVKKGMFLLSTNGEVSIVATQFSRGCFRWKRF